MKNLQELETERKELHAQLDMRNNPMPIVKKLKENEAQMNVLKVAKILAEVNREQAKKREIAKLVWECEQPTEDITTADGSLHKIKAKKYPKLSALQYVRINFKDGHTTDINVNGYKFQMFKTKYEYNKPTEYTRPNTFEEFLDLNGIQPEEITGEQFATFAQKLNEATEELKAAIKKYDSTREQLDCYQMQNIGLVNQNNTHVYFYEAKRF